MRITTSAIAGALIVGVAVPAVAATKKASWTPTFATCEALAMNRGVDITERRSTEGGQSPYRQFMVACLAGPHRLGNADSRKMGQLRAAGPPARRQRERTTIPGKRTITLSAVYEVLPCRKGVTAARPYNQVVPVGGPQLLRPCAKSALSPLVQPSRG